MILAAFIGGVIVGATAMFILGFVLMLRRRPNDSYRSEWDQPPHKGNHHDA
jgi:hypothetical protein